MRSPVLFVPLVTTVIAFVFTVALASRYRAKGGPHLLWWAIGTAIFKRSGFVILYRP